MDATRTAQRDTTAGQHRRTARKDATRVTWGKTLIDAIPSRADLFRETCKRLGAADSSRSDAVKLDAIIHCVQGTANLDDLNSVALVRPWLKDN